jgi:hypothetical protein
MKIRNFCSHELNNNNHRDHRSHPRCCDKNNIMTIDTTNMCSHLQKKLFEEDGEYHRIWIALQNDPELTAVVRSRQLHIYRNSKKVLVLAGKSAPKIIREDRISEML